MNTLVSLASSSLPIRKYRGIESFQDRGDRVIQYCAKDVFLLAVRRKDLVKVKGRVVIMHALSLSRRRL